MKSPVLFYLIFCAVLIAVFGTITAEAAGFRENKAWQFESPSDKVVKLQREQTRLLNRGGYFKGKHAAQYISVGKVQIKEATVGAVQSTQNIANWSDVQLNGDDNYLNVGQDLNGTQSGVNTNENN